MLQDLEFTAFEDFELKGWGVGFTHAVEYTTAVSPPTPHTIPQFRKIAGSDPGPKILCPKSR